MRWKIYRKSLEKVLHSWLTSKLHTGKTKMSHEISECSQSHTHYKRGSRTTAQQYGGEKTFL